jgi:hypothetical protein
VLAAASVIVVLFLDTTSSARRVGASSSPSNADDRAATDASSTYVELDSWVYPAIERLAAQGVIRYEFLGLRPWTRRAIYQMLAQATQGS